MKADVGDLLGPDDGDRDRMGVIIGLRNADGLRLGDLLAELQVRLAAVVKARE